MLGYPRCLVTRDAWLLRTCPQVYSVKTALTPEQFDAAYAAEPARSSCYARLRAAIGDTRSGRELLRDWHSDR